MPAMDEESEDTSRHSRNSFFGFDFETPGSQDHDEISQLHESIAELPSGLRPPDDENGYVESSGASHYSSAVSNFLDDASDTTETEQPAGSNWPLRS